MSLLSLIEHVTVLSVISASPGFAAEPAPDQPINLAGDWRFEIDRTDSGTAEAWFKKDLSGSISLPGSMSENGLGDPMKAIRQNTWGDGWTDKPVWHPQLKIDYRGKAWYQKKFTVPASWNGMNVELYLERVWKSVATGNWPNNAYKQTVMLKEPVKSRFIRLEATKSADDSIWTSVAEFDVITAD